MENSTLGRKPGNDMKKNASTAKMGESAAAWQKRDKGLGFNGQDNGSSQRNGTGMKYSYNQHSGVSNEDTGFGQPQMPNRKGNIADQKDRTRSAPSTANRGQTNFSNPDMINMGAGPRNAGSTRTWDPSSGQNFRGNPDRIQDRQQYNNRGNKD